MIRVVRRFVWFLVCVIVIASIFVVVKNSDNKIKKVDVVSNDGLQYISKQDFIDEILENSQKDWFDINVDSMELYVSGLEGVDYSLVKKIWPSTLVVYIYDRIPVAFWGSSEILLDNMQIISPQVFNLTKFIPVINSDQTDSKEYVYGEYVELDNIAKNNGSRVEVLDYKGNQFAVLLDDGFYVKLGSKDLDKRLERFFELYMQVKDYQNVAYFDMRYEKGFVVKY